MRAQLQGMGEGGEGHSSEDFSQLPSSLGFETLK